MISFLLSCVFWSQPLEKPPWARSSIYTTLNSSFWSASRFSPANQSRLYWVTSRTFHTLARTELQPNRASGVMTGVSDVGASCRRSSDSTGLALYGVEERKRLGCCVVGQRLCSLTVNVNTLHIYGLAQEWDNQGPQQWGIRTPVELCKRVCVNYLIGLQPTAVCVRVLVS